MSKFSVKKPVTIFVAVLIVIVFGIMGYTKMTPDLLPDMDFPYIILMTTYPGAAPEEVEATVTKPIEQSMATLDNLKSINSSSAENYSMVSLEFETDTSMDAVTVDILQNIQTLSDNWPDEIGSPYLMKINPNMLPVAAIAIDMADMDRAELSQFARQTLIPSLEGTSGVARISTSGLLDRQIAVTIEQEKIDKTNEKLAKAVRNSLSDVEQQLTDAQADLDDARAELKSQQNSLNSSQQSTGSTMANASLKLDETLAAYQSYSAQLTSMQASQSALQAESAAYAEGLSQIESGLEQIDAGIAQINTTQEQFAPLLALELPDETPLETIVPDEQSLSLLQAQGCATLGDVRTLNETLTQQLEQLQTQREPLVEQQTQANERIAQIDTELANLNTELTALQKIVDEYAAAIQTAQNGYVSIQQNILSAAAGFGTGQAQLSSGLSNLDQAQTDLESARQEYDDSVQNALKQANLADTITVETVSSILSAQNFDMPAGYIEHDGVSWIVSVGDELDSVEALEDLVLFDTGVDGMEPIRLSDVATVETTDNSDSIYASLNGNEGLILMFYKQSTYSTAGVSDNLHEKLDQLAERYDTLTVTNLMDQGTYIYMITDSIISSLLFGALFAIIVLFLFLLDWRPTLITLFSIPVSLLFAVALMYFTGVTLNMMSLAGLAVSVGMLVDNSVVVIENTYRLRALGESVIKAAVSGAAQVAGAITASTLTTICVFLPIVFTDGITRQLFTSMALTITYALIASLIIALTLVPAMSCTLLAKTPPRRKRPLDALTPVYRRAVGWAVRHKAVVLLLAVALLITSAVLVLSRGFSFLPDTRTNQISLSVTMPEDSTFEEQCELADQLIERIQPIEGVQTIGAVKTDSEGGMTLLSNGSGDMSFYLTLTDDADRSTDTIETQIEQACADLPCEVDTGNGSLMSSYSEMLSGSGISVNVYANDLDRLQEAARSVADCLSGVAGVAEVSDGLEDPTPELHVAVDKQAAMEHNLTVAQVYAELAKALTTETSSISLSVDDNSYDVILSDDEEPLDLNTVKNYTFSVTDQEQNTSRVRLGDIAEITQTKTLSTIGRIEQRRYLAVTAQVDAAHNISLVSNDAAQALAKLDLPDSVQYELTGENEAIMDTLSDLLLMLLVGVLLVYLIMVAQFQSLKAPFIVMFTIPLAFTGGFLALWLCGMDISMLSMLGLVMLVGIIVNNGIVLVDCINANRRAGMERREAIVDAAVTRLRPILMTSLTTVLGLSVMALGRNESTAMIQPLAVTCIGGMLYATLMTLFVIPAIYDLFSRRELRKIDESELTVSDK